MHTRSKRKRMPMSFTRGDPLTSMLSSRMAAPLWSIGLGWFLFINAPLIILSLTGGFWVSRPNQVGLSVDYTWWMFELLTVPATVIFFFWMPDGISQVLNRLYGNHVLVSSQSGQNTDSLFSEFVDSFDRSYCHWIWSASCAVLALALMVSVTIPQNRAYASWVNSGPLVFSLIMLHWLTYMYLLALILVRGLIVIVWFSRLFREFAIEVRVMHPDKAGGLAPLGQFSVKVGYLIGIYGFSLALVTLAENYVLTGQFEPTINTSIILSALIYIIASPIAFFAPIGAAHAAMKQAKDALILQIADQYEMDQDRVQQLLGADPEELGKSIQKLEHLQTLHDMASKFPIWPFNTASLVRFFTSILSPIAIGLIPIVVDFFVNMP